MQKIRTINEIPYLFICKDSILKPSQIGVGTSDISNRFWRTNKLSYLNMRYLKLART